MAGNIWVSASGMQTDSWAIDAYANDIANINTTGFRAQLPVAAATAPGAAYPAGLAVGPAVAPNVLAGGGAIPLTLLQNTAQGGAQPTGRPLDLYIAGSGYFALQAQGGGTLYTRDGRLSIDASGTLVDAQGRAVLSVGGKPIQVPPGASGVQVGADGSVTAVVKGATQTVGQIGLALPVSAQGMQGVGTGALAATPAAGKITTLAPGQGQAGRLQSGMLEDSNSNLSVLLPDLLSAQQAYAMNARALSTSLQMWSLDNQL